MTFSATPAPLALQAQLGATRQHAKATYPAAIIGVFEDNAAAMSGPEFTEQALREGALAPRFTLPNAAGHPVSLAALLARGPVVLTFYRGAWCPYCNTQLQAYQASLADIQNLGASLVAISPQKPDGSLSMKEKHDLQFEVLSDASNEVARQFRLVFTLAQPVQDISLKIGNDIAAGNADGTWELPVPAT